MSTTTDLTTLKINYLTQAQYDAEVQGGTVEENELYMTPASGGGGISDVEVNGVSVVTNDVAEITMPTNVSDLNNDSGFITAETDPVFSNSAAAGISSSDISTWNGKSDFSGDYDDLTNKPTIPSNTSDLINDSNFITPTFASSGTSANFIVEQYTKAFSNIASGDTWTWEETKTKTGYYPLGIVGYRVARSTLLPYSCRLTNVGSGTCGIELSARAVAAANAASAYVYILWVKQ